MKKYGFVCLILIEILFKNGYAAEMSLEKMHVNQCENLLCVRQHIDGIDTQIVNLIGLRLNYVKQAGQIKKNRPIHDQAREDKILKKVGEQAQNVGYSPTIIQEIFKTILKQSNLYESKIQKQDN